VHAQVENQSIGLKVNEIGILPKNCHHTFNKL